MRRTDLQQSVLADVPNIESARMVRIELDRGQSVGVHRHPCDVAGYVLDGTIRYQRHGTEALILHPGDAFFEPRDETIAHFDNASAHEPATFLACYLLAPGVDEVIEMIDET
ncbi:cupin domain-containing protein [Williamsia sterculiae]|uniref:Cupin domain-containing protein n=1 Tax=Williamsia sterculiae TaxID=1344003 RepID=A0A1N7HA18_9NOCA|nr:cupin domain-containing protein [Williamsia sterculiae]SIS21734.1 Cupin domain-containing protein [Williamsia sterculiae]